MYFLADLLLRTVCTRGNIRGAVATTKLNSTMVSSTAAMLVVMGMLMVSNESSSAFGVSREVVPGLSLRLRGGSLVKERQRPSLVTLADQLAPEEEKPDLRRNPSRLILEDLKVCASDTFE